jgi:uncharacterized protein with HEPN domain
VTRRDLERLADIRDAIAAIRAHVARGELADGLIFDAVRVRLIEIGEAIKSLPTELVETEPGIAWSDIAGMRDRLAHRYFDTEHSIVAATVDQDLGPLEAAVVRLEARVRTEP